MTTLFGLLIILFVAMRLVGGEKGTRSFIALFLNFLIIFMTIFLLANPSINPILLTLIACLVIACVNLFYINGLNLKSITAFIGTILTLLVLIGIIFIIVKQSMIQGFGIEEIEESTYFILYIGIDFIELTIATIIMAIIGAITDTAISISSAMNEIYAHHPEMNRLRLFESGMNVGKDILGTTTNTLFFAFIGGYLALILWFEDLNYSFGEIINSEVFSSEIISILAIGTGAILVIPITAWIATLIFIHYHDKVVSI